MDANEVTDVFELFSSSISVAHPSISANPDLDSRTRCAFCLSWDGTILDGVWSCGDCCTILGRVLDYGAEWRVFHQEDGRSNASPNTGRCSTSASDLISPLGCSLRAGPSCSTIRGQRSQTSRCGVGAVMMAKHQSWNALTYRERSLCRVFDLMTSRLASHSIASSIVQEAKQMYKQVSCGRIFRGECRVAVVAACVYMAMRSSHAPRSICEVASIFEPISRSSMIRGCNLCHSAMPRRMDSSSAKDFMPRFCCRLGIAPEHVNLCKRIALRVDDLFLVTDCTPPSVVGAIIHLVNLHLLLGIRREDIAEACLVSAGTIARCCRRLKLHQEVLLDPVSLQDERKGGGDFLRRDEAGLMGVIGEREGGGGGGGGGLMGDETGAMATGGITATNPSAASSMVNSTAFILPTSADTVSSRS